MRRLAGWLVLAAACGAAWGQDLAASDFAWRASVEAPSRPGVARLALPAEALARLQSRDFSDLRVFDSQGRPVAHALRAVSAPQAATRQPTEPFRALPLATGPAGAAPSGGAVQVRVQGAGGQSVWVQLGSGGATPAPSGLPAALFDTRGLKTRIAGLRVAGEWPRNTAVALSVASSQDLDHWSPLAARGRLYRFDGADAPANDVLVFEAPVTLEGRFLRLEWTGQPGVRIASVQGLVQPAAATVDRPGIDLPEGHPDGSNAIEWELPFATPLAQLHFTPARPGTLLPVRVLGRDQASQPWRPLANTVIHRLPGDGSESVNAPAPLRQATPRWLRLESTHGMALAGVQIQARALFDPLELVFVSGNGGAHQVAAGRKATPSAAVPLAMLATPAGLRADQLPLARIVATDAAPVPARPTWAAWLPRNVDEKAAGLWLVLALGVLVLGSVAWSLLRALDRAKAVKPPPASPESTPEP